MIYLLINFFLRTFCFCFFELKKLYWNQIKRTLPFDRNLKNRLINRLRREPIWLYNKALNPIRRASKITYIMAQNLANRAAKKKKKSGLSALISKLSWWRDEGDRDGEPQLSMMMTCQPSTEFPSWVDDVSNWLECTKVFEEPQ